MVAEAMPAGEDKVAQLCHQLPQRDLESASLPETPIGQQLEVLEIWWPLLCPMDLPLHGSLDYGLFWPLSPALRTPVLLPTLALSFLPRAQPQQRPGGAEEKARLALGLGSCEGLGNLFGNGGVSTPSPTQDLSPLQDRAW